MSNWCSGLAPLVNRPGDPVKDPAAVARARAANATKREKRFPEVPNPRGLSASEWAVMTAMIESGDTWGEIAERLCMAPKTAATHSMRAREKMDAKTTMHAVLMIDRWMRAEKVDLELVLRFIDGKPEVEMRPTYTSIREQRHAVAEQGNPDNG